MKKFEKRGLSQVVMTLIIILLALVALAVIWIVISNLLDSNREGIEFASNRADFEIISANYVPDEELSEDKIDINIMRRTGEGNVVALSFVFEGNGKSQVIREPSNLEILGTNLFVFGTEKLTQFTNGGGNVDLSLVERVEIAPIYALETGKEKVGNPVDESEVKLLQGVSSSDLTPPSIEDFSLMFYDATISYDLACPLPYVTGSPSSCVGSEGLFSSGNFKIFAEISDANLFSWDVNVYLNNFELVSSSSGNQNTIVSNEIVNFDFNNKQFEEIENRLLNITISAEDSFGNKNQKSFEYFVSPLSENYICNLGQIRGDLNGDFILDVDDYNLAFANLFSLPPYESICCADVNNDGNFDNVDLTILNNHLNNGYPISLPLICSG